MIQDIPCDMTKSSFCQIPGGSYPWSSVRRYIYENQGLMRRMYGDQRHSFILRNEIEDTREKYDTISYYEGRHRSVYGPRSLNPHEDNPVPHSEPSVQESSSSTAPPTPFPSSSTSPAENSSSNFEEKYESTPGEEMEDATLSNRSVLYSNFNSSLNDNSSSTLTTPPPASSSTINEDVQEEAPPAGHTKKGVNACPVKEEVVAPFWANNTRVSLIYLVWK